MKKRFLLIMLLAAIFAPLAMNAQGLMKASGITLQAAPDQELAMQRMQPTRDAGWLQYDNNTPYSMIGSQSDMEWTWGVMFPSSMLGTNNTLSKVAIYEYTYNTGDITINIYSGGDDAPGTLLYTETVEALGAFGLQEVELAQAVTFDPAQNLWITLTETGTYVMLYCQMDEPDINGQWVAYGGTWYNITDLGGSENAVWMIRGYVEYADPTACPKPTGLTASNITLNTATLTWNSEVGAYQVVYSDREGFNPDDVTPIDVTANPYMLTGLNDGTTYYVYVRANCGDSFSDWSSMATFTTPGACDAPYNLEVSHITPFTADFSWEGWQDAYTVRYQAPLFFEDFNDGIPSDWTVIDNDGDGNNWVTGQVGGIDNTYCATSASYSSSALTPDNWLVTPQISLQGNMSVWMRAQDPSWPEEHFAIYLSTTGNTVNDFTTTLVGETVATGEYVEYTADLSSYNGQMGYIAIRHFNCTDMFRLNVDNFMIGGADWVTINNATSPTSLANLSPETTYLVQVQGACAAGQTGWSGVTFTTPSNCEVPSALTSADVTANAATLSWTGYQNSYNVQYRPVAVGDVLVEQNFDDSSLGGWTTIDADGDGYEWVLGSAVGGIYLAEGSSLAGSGNGASDDLVVSGSFSNVTTAALTPDNYLVSPQITLGGKITFWACGQDASYVAEHFGVAVSTRGNSSADDFTTIQEWTMTAKGIGAKTGVTRSGSRAQGTWYQYTVNLSDYAGQTGYVAIRHFNCTDMFMLDVDDITIYGPAETTYNWITATANEPSLNLTGLTAETEYEWQVQGVNASCDHGVTEWSEIANFTTLSGCQAPTDLEAADITSNAATLSWTGIQDSYNLRYRTSEDAEILFYDDFSSYEIIDEENGLYGIGNWTTVNLQEGGGNMNGVFAFLYTENPPQYLISPELTGIENGSTLRFLYAAYNANYPESFMVGFSTTDNAVDSFTWGEEVTTTNTSGAYYTASIPDGATYFAIQCTSNDQYVLFVTDFMIYGPIIPAGEWVEVNNVTSPYTLTGLNPETYYDWQVSGAECTEWSDIEYFLTLEQTTSTLTVNLNAGANWFSTSVEITLDDLKSALLTALNNANGIKITTQNNGYVNWNGNTWKGKISLFEIGQYFMVEVPSDCEITLEGEPINPAEHPLTINPGANWIGFPFSESMTVIDAFAGFPTRTDRITSQANGYTSYNGNTWKGSLTTLEPGQGYLYNSAAEETKTFTYPTGTSKAAQITKKQMTKTKAFDAKKADGKLEIKKTIRK